MKNETTIGIVVALGLILAIPTMAQAYISSDGVQYTATRNEHGAVLNGENGDLIYLGKRCDAVDPDAGKGSWSWANGGFCVNLPARKICFARQEVPVELEGPNDCLM
ncbi:hypothetical protein RA28_19710 [Ruegeria sp. ANG-S4]|uniref:hypothetical protein n=1 Tax=Ruegeria sp. ANG-S4 TaxID=1577904 RepID=UPI00057EC0DF|nr:hypothetical protein [Ruegeria sp. ANG-S4]KIC43854.1 hypothetical protein RA28_19710 [Ruegeria sp. ANG-S4]